MTTSSDHRQPKSAPHTGGEHWYELTATLPRESTEEFAQWLSEELDSLEVDFEQFVTPNSRIKGLRRS